MKGGKDVLEWRQRARVNYEGLLSPVDHEMRCPQVDFIP